MTQMTRLPQMMKPQMRPTMMGQMSMDMALAPTLQERTGRVPLLPGIHRALATTMWERARKIDLFPGMQMAFDLTAQTRSIMVGLAPMFCHRSPAVWQRTAKAAGTFFARSPTIRTTRSYYSCFVQLRYAIQYWHVPFLNPFQKGNLFKATPQIGRASCRERVSPRV